MDKGGMDKGFGKGFNKGDFGFNKGGKGSSPQDAHAALVDQVKQMQRSNWDAKLQWWAYCGEYSDDGSNDPARHTAEFIQGFFKLWFSGERLPEPKKGKDKGKGDKTMGKPAYPPCAECESAKEGVCWTHCGTERDPRVMADPRNKHRYSPW